MMSHEEWFSYLEKPEKQGVVEERCSCNFQKLGVTRRMAATTKIEQHYKLGHKARYIITMLGHMPFHIFTKLS